MGERWLTLAEVAEKIGRHPRTLKRQLPALQDRYPYWSGGWSAGQSCSPKPIINLWSEQQHVPHRPTRGKIWHARGTVRIGKEVVHVAEFSTGQATRALAQQAAEREAGGFAKGRLTVVAGGRQG